ncbi:hypothetical protein JCM10908_001983 [Rhodotorula pacifica]|uniref:eukaryotic translation initiation factor 4E n=1 Tax=Rhodotorula pacifica TaxID=1495444 RepID=UPI00316F174C
MSARPSPLSGSSSSTSRRNFPTRGNGVPSPSLQARSVGAAAGTGESYVAPQRKKSGGPVLSLANGTGTGVNGHDGEAGLHPLKHNWDVWFSQRQGATKGAKKDAEGKGAAGQKEKESREDWEGGVVKLGGFSTIESLHPLLAHLVPPSELPGSLNSSHTLFTSESPDLAPSPSNTVCDYNVFRSNIAPAWEDAANAGGGRWVLRLRKGVADRIWEEVVFALVSERIGGEDERIGEKVNGVVLSVRREEDILSLWVAPSSRADRDTIRDSLRTALTPLLTATSLAALQLDYKPHPVTSGTASSHGRLQDLSNGDSPSTPSSTHSRGHSLRRGDHERRSHSGAMRHSSAFGGAIGDSASEAFGTPLSERRSHGGTPRGPGFSGYVARVRTPGAADGSSSPVAASPLAPLDGLNSIERIERRVRESSPGVIGGRPGMRSRESSFRGGDDDRWGRL